MPARCSTLSEEANSRRPTPGGQLEVMLRSKPGWAPGRSPIRGRGASAALRAGPIGVLRRSSRLPFPADTGPLGSASLWKRVVSCDVATLIRVLVARPVASAAHWVAGTCLASGVSAMQGRCRCLQLPPRGMSRVLWGQSGRHQPTRRPHLLEWKRGLRGAACATAPDSMGRLPKVPAEKAETSGAQVIRR